MPRRPPRATGAWRWLQGWSRLLVAVLDGFCHGSGLDRAAVMRRILREWSERQLHVATLICRTTGRNPFQTERRRNAPGAAPERGGV